MNSLMRKMFGAVRLYKFGIFKVILNRLFPETFTHHDYILYKYDLEGKVPYILPAKEAVTINRVENSEEGLFQKFRKKFPADEFLTRMRQSTQTAFIATINGEVTGYSWVAEKELFIESLNHNFVLNDDEIFIYACFVSRENRGKRIYPAMLHEILEEYNRRDKYRMAYIGVLAANKGSIRGIEKAGFIKDKMISYFKFFNREKWWEKECPSAQLETASETDNESNPPIPEPAELQ